MRVKLQYATLSIEIEAKTIESTVDALEVAGNIISFCSSYKDWGRPQVKVEAVGRGKQHAR